MGEDWPATSDQKDGRLPDMIASARKKSRTDEN